MKYQQMAALLDLNIYIYTSSTCSSNATSECCTHQHKYTQWMGSEILTAADVEITTFWDVTPCSLVDA
jgi:hypothetical protein